MSVLLTPSRDEVVELAALARDGDVLCGAGTAEPRGSSAVAAEPEAYVGAERNSSCRKLRPFRAADPRSVVPRSPRPRSQRSRSRSAARASLNFNHLGDLADLHLKIEPGRSAPEPEARRRAGLRCESRSPRRKSSTLRARATARHRPRRCPCSPDVWRRFPHWSRSLWPPG